MVKSDPANAVSIVVLRDRFISLPFHRTPDLICRYRLPVNYRLLIAATRRCIWRLRASRGGIEKLRRLVAIAAIELSQRLGKGAVVHDLGELESVGALLPETILAGAENPVFPAVVPQ
jgi:hypothetical protein